MYIERALLNFCTVRARCVCYASVTAAVWSRSWARAGIATTAPNTRRRTSVTPAPTCESCDIVCKQLQKQTVDGLNFQLRNRATYVEALFCLMFCKPRKKTKQIYSPKNLF